MHMCEVLMDQAWMGSTLSLFTVSELNYMLHSTAREDRKGVLAVAPRGRGSYTQAPRLKSVVICYLFLSWVTLSQLPNHVSFYFAMSLICPPSFFSATSLIYSQLLLSGASTHFAFPSARFPKGSRCLLQLCILNAYRHLISIKKCLLCENLTD